MTAGPAIYVPEPIRQLAERAAYDWPVFMYDGLGIMPTDEQVEARAVLGRPGPRDRQAGDPKTLYVSGGQRAGKTVELMGWHTEACLYKIGVDNTDQRFYDNYLYKTLAVAPTGDLALKLWQVFDEVSKGASDAQYDRRARRARGGRFLHKFKAGKAGDWPVIRFDNGARTDFRSTEGYAFRLEGDQWWFTTWDEWASQPDREIEFVLTDVLMGRNRDHDGKIVPAAWPKAQTERHLIAAIRKIEQGLDFDSKVVYLSAEKAFFSNRSSLKAERARKSDAQWMRTVLGRPAGGASIEFPADAVENMVKAELAWPQLPEQGFRYFTSWDLGIAHDSTVGITWRIPQGDVQPQNKARIVNATEIKGGETLTVDSIAFAVAKEQLIYRSQSAVDATGMGGLGAIRQMRDLKPPPLAFKARSNDRLHGNMRLAAITNGLDMLTWGRPSEGSGSGDIPWGLIESPRIVPLLDQLANFDRDAKNISDDWVMAFLIGLWYIKRFYVLARGSHTPVDFNVAGGPRKKRIMVDMRGIPHG
jgi:hypothetical protein